MLEYEIRQEGNLFKCGRKLADGNMLVNALQLPEDTTLTMEEVEPVLAEMNRQLMIQYLEQSKMDS